MNTRRTPPRRIEDNDVKEEIPPQVEEVDHVPHGCQGSQGDHVRIVGGCDDVIMLSNRDIRDSLLALVGDMTTQANFKYGARVNVVKRTMKSKLRDIVRMNPPIFLGSKVGEHPREFLG